MYNRSELSKALKEAKAAKSQKKVKDVHVDIKDEGYKNPKNSNKPALKLYTDSIYNPTDKDLMLYPDNGMAPVFKPAWDTTTTYFPGANSIVEKQVARDGGRFVDKNDPGNNALELHMFYDKDLYEDGGEYLDLTDKEIEEYRKGGYVVEELPIAQTAGTTETPQVQTPPNPMNYFDTQKPYTYKSGDPLVLNKLKLQEDAVIPYYNERTGEFTTQEGTFKPDQYEKVEVQPGVFVARFKNRDDINIDYSMDPEVNKKYYKHYTKGNQYWPIYSTVPYDPLLQQWRSEDAAETVEQPVVTQRKGGYVNNQITHFQKAGTTGGPQAAPMPTGLIPLDAQIKSVSNSPRIEDQRKAEMLRAQKAKEEAEKKKRIEEYKRKEAEKKKQAEAAAKWYDEEKAKRDALGAVMDVAPVQPASSTNVDLEYLVPSVGQRKSQERGLEMLKDQLYEQQETLRRRGFKDAYEYEKSPEGLLRDQALAAEAAWKESGEEAPMVDLGEMAFYDGRAQKANQYTFGPGAKGSYTTDLGTYDSRTGKFTPRPRYYSGSGALKSVDEIWTLPLLATRAPYLAGEGLMGLLSTQIPGTSGATLGQAINAGFLGKGLYDAVPFEYFMPGMEGHQSTPGAWYEAYQSGEGDYRNAIEKTLWNAADFLGAGETKEGAKLLAQDIKNTGKYLTTQTPLRNAYKINPLAGRLGQYNRVVGQDAVDDILESGLVRVNENAGVAQDLGPLGVVYRQTPYPSFAKAAPQKTYAEQVISEGKTPYIISTNRPMRVSTLGRHGRGSTQFPVDEAGKYMTGFPASEAKVFEFGEPHWLRGYKEVPAEKVLPKYKTNSTLGNQRAFTVEGDIDKGIGTNLTTSDVQRTIDDQLKWITSEEYYKRRSANTGETYDQIFADVNKTIKNAQDAKVYLNAELPGNIGGRQTPRSLNTLWGPPTIEVSRTTANPPMVLKHEVGHLYSPAGFDVSTSKLHRGFDNPNVASLPANKRGVYANYPKIGGDDMDEYLQLGYEQQVRHLNARDQILSKYNLDKEAPLTEDQVYDFVTNWNKKILNRKAGFSDADSNFHFGKEEDYDDIWLEERNKIVQDQKDKYGLEDPVKRAQLSKEDIKRLTEEANRLLSKKITDVLNKAWVTVPVGVSVGAAVTQEYQKGGALTKAQTGQSTRNANNTIQLADNLNPFSSLYYDPLNNNPLDNNKFIANQAYTYAGRPGSYYKMVDGKMQIKNKDTDWKYVEMKDPTGKRLKTLEAGLKSGSTKVYNKPKATTTINDFYYSKNELQNEQIIDRALQCRSDANGNCLGSAFLYYDKYVAPKLGMKSSWELKESAGLTSGKKGANPNYNAWGESVDSWELRGAFGDKAKQYYAAPLSNPSELYQKLQGMTQAEKDKYFRDMNLPIGTIITGGVKGYDTGKQVGSSYNEKKGYVASHHSGIVVGYDDYGTPIIYDYGNVRKISDPANLLMTSDFPINNIFTPQENVQYTYDYLKKGNKLKQEVTPLNMNIPNIENISDIDEMRPFLDNLEKNKQKIMDTFNISDSEYNELAKISAATALAETKGGKDFGTWRYGLPAYTLDKTAPFVNTMAQVYTAGLYNPEVGKSAGITQINPESVWASDGKNGWRNPQLVNRLEQLGITRDTYDPWNPYHQAVITMGLTQSNIKTAKANASKNPNVSKDLSDAELAYYQWNIPSALTTTDYEKAARGENENVKRFMEYYNMLNRPNRQRGGTVEYLTQDEINQLRAGGITVIEE